VIYNQNKMIKIPDITDMIAGRFTQDKPPEASTADADAIVLKMERADQSSGRHGKRLTELRKLAALRKRIVHRMLDSSIEQAVQPKRPHLKIVK
jgi:hypothetical protein